MDIRTNIGINLVEVFKALGDENRISIINMLCNGEHCVCDILDKVELSQPTISHHLKILRQSGLVNTRKKGKWVYYSVNEETLKQCQEYFGESLLLLKDAKTKPVCFKHCDD